MNCINLNQPCPISSCPGLTDPGVCVHVHNLNGWRKQSIDQQAILAHENCAGSDQQATFSMTTYQQADLCPLASGPCGCGVEPRQCHLSDPPADVWRPDCLGCQADRAILIRAHTVQYSGYGQIASSLGVELEKIGRPVHYQSITHDPDNMVPLPLFVRRRLIR